MSLPINSDKDEFDILLFKFCDFSFLEKINNLEKIVFIIIKLDIIYDKIKEIFMYFQRIELL